VPATFFLDSQGGVLYSPFSEKTSSYGAVKGYRLTEKHFMIVLILLKRNSGDSWGAILETGNSKLGKEMRI